MVHQKEIWSTKKNFGTPNRNLVDQKFPETDQKFPETGQFFFARPKKMRKSPDNWLTKRLTKTTWTGLIKSEPGQKKSETEQKFPETGQFFWSTKKNEKKTGQLVDQETDQKYMDAAFKVCSLNRGIRVVQNKKGLIIFGQYL